MSIADATRCPKCGAPLPKDAPHGLCPRCLGALNFETQTLPDEPKSAPPLSPAELASFFPQLEILDFLGKGGMGAVYKARQKQLDRVVALKVLPPGIGNDPAFMERFAREAKALARLNHPGIVTLYEFGHATCPAPGAGAGQTPLYFFLMEYVDGVNLRELLRGGRISPREALAIVPQICDALQYAHDQGIVHRDIKPENILVDRRGRVKVADFGIAKLIDTGREPAMATSTGAAGLTEAGKTVGTPSYMAPEQRERPQVVDHRADIYALGVVFYEMLTGELPGEKLVPPSGRVRVDVRLDEIVLHAMEKAPERRYQHVSEVRTAVNTVAETPPVMPRPAAPAPPVPQPPRAASSGGKVWKIFGIAATAWVLLLVSLVVLTLVSMFVSAFLRARQQAHIEAARRAGAQQASEAAQAMETQRASNARAAEMLPSQDAKPSRSQANVVGAWERLANAPIGGRSSASAVWTGKEMIIFGGEGMNVSFSDGARFNPRTDTWKVLPPEGASPSARTSFTAIWTGEKMIVWGGFGGSYGQNVVHNDGSQFVLETESWWPVSTRNAPSPRFNHVAVWTGSEMIVWGGYSDSHSWYAGGRAPGHLNSGGRYDPLKNTWRETTLNGAPSARFNHVAVWTGHEMIVWGGGDAAEAFNDGGRYDPLDDYWRPVSTKGAPGPRCMPVAVWTGKEMIVWGGADRNRPEYFQDGGRYDPETDLWKPISMRDAPKGRIFAQAVWTGRYMLVWGGVNDADTAGTGDPQRYLAEGALYDPQKDTWTPIQIDGAPGPRLTTAVWTGDSLLTFGGYNNVHRNDTYRLKLR